MGWKRDGRSGGSVYEYDLDGPQGLLARDEELAWLMAHGRRDWKLVNGRIAASRAPTALEGTYMGLQAYPPGQTQAWTLTATSAPGISLWTTALYTPILANAVLAPSFYKIWAFGTITTTTTSITASFMPALGQGVFNVAPITNYKTFGTSGVATLDASAATSLWKLDGDLLVTSVGTAGACYFMGVIQFGTVATPASATTSEILIGGTQATSVDFTGTTSGLPGFVLGGMASTGSDVTGVTQSVVMASGN